MTETAEALRDRKEWLRSEITFLHDLLTLLREYPQCAKGVGEVVALVEDRMNIHAAEVAGIERQLAAMWAEWQRSVEGESTS